MFLYSYIKCFKNYWQIPRTEVFAMKKNVLIIEDEENIANAEKIVLQDNFNVEIANDGEEGLKKARELKPDLIVLDLMMPNRGGYDVCYHLRQDDDLKHIKILMVTAKDQQIDEDKGMLVGANEYLTKPFEPEDLLNLALKLTND